MQERSSLQGFLEQLGVKAAEVSTPRDALDAARRFSARTGLDEELIATLIRKAFELGSASSDDGSLIASRIGPSQHVTVALRPDASEELHEVRNAVTAAAGWARIAREEGAGTARGDRALEAIEAASMLAMDVARAPTRTAPRADRSQSVGAAVAQAVELVEPLARQRRVQVKVTVPPELRVPLSRSELVSAVSNLVKNAVEAGAPGDAVTIGADLFQQEVVLTVHNPTRGEALPSVGRSSKGPGRGVGLRVVSSIALGSGGSLRFSHPKNGGTLATLVLPLARPAAAHVPTATVDEPPRSRSGTRPAARARRDSTDATRSVSVLVVDDESSIRNLITTALEMSGFHALGVGSPDELRVSERRSFSLALVDLRLGQLDGLAVARQLVRDGWTRRIALMTGAPPEQIPPDVIAVVRKPFDLDELIVRLGEWTARPRLSTKGIRRVR